mgnify:CR=1 FL=1
MIEDVLDDGVHRPHPPAALLRVGQRRAEARLERDDELDRVDRVQREPGAEEGNITIILFDGGWWWFIPFRGTLTSVGCVLQRGFTIERRGMDADALFAAALAQTPAAAELLRGARIFLSRTDFPAAQDGEYYWVDLIGLEVINREGVSLGEVRDLLSTGPQTVLVLQQEQGDKPIERMIPFVAAFVDQVDLAGRRITVDWQPDY